MRAVALVRDRGHHSVQHRDSPYPPAAGVQLFPPEKENALQTEAPALVADLEQPEPPPIERLGETVEFGSLLLRLLALQGWKITTRPAVGGGVVVMACRAGVVVERHGETVGHVATDVFQLAGLQERG